MVSCLWYTLSIVNGRVYSLGPGAIMFPQIAKGPYSKLSTLYFSTIPHMKNDTQTRRKEYEQLIPA